MAGIWEELGIAPTSDTGAIRRAYAARVKQVRPDVDREGFSRLREAYEAALRAAAGVVSVDPNEVEIVGDDLGSDGGPGVAVEQPGPVVSVPEAAEHAAFRAAMARSDVVAAAELLAAARDQRSLFEHEEAALTRELLTRLEDDRSLSSRVVHAAALQLGWYGGPLTLSFDRLEALHGRINAEDWLERLQERAGSDEGLFGGERAAARLLLGAGPVRWSWLLPPDPPLRRWVARFEEHEPWIGRLFDGTRIEAARRLAESPFTRVNVVLWFGAVFAGMVLWWHLGVEAAGVLAVPLAWFRRYVWPVVAIAAVGSVVQGVVAVLGGR